MSRARKFWATTATFITLAVVQPRPVLAQTPPAFPPEQLTGIVTQMSDALVTQINAGSCQDFATLLSKVQASGGSQPDPNSIIGQVLLSVQNSDQLKGIVVSKVGPPLISRVLACNMVPLDALSMPGASPAAPATP